MEDEPPASLKRELENADGPAAVDRDTDAGHEGISGVEHLDKPTILLRQRTALLAPPLLTQTAPQSLTISSTPSRIVGSSYNIFLSAGSNISDTSSIPMSFPAIPCVGVPEMRCAICLATTSMTSPCMTQCSHTFCFACISEALTLSPLCPVCRVSVQLLTSVTTSMPPSTGHRSSPSYMTSREFQQSNRQQQQPLWTATVPSTMASVKQTSSTADNNAEALLSEDDAEDSEAAEDTSATSLSMSSSPDAKKLLQMLANSQSALDLEECRAMLQLLKRRENYLVSRQDVLRKLLCREFLVKLRDEKRLVLDDLNSQLSGVESDLKCVDDWLQSSAVASSVIETEGERQQQQNHVPPDAVNAEDDDNFCPSDVSLAPAESVPTAGTTSRESSEQSGGQAPGGADCTDISKTPPSIQRQLAELQPYLNGRLQKLKINFEDLSSLYFEHQTRTKGTRALNGFVENLARFAQFTSIKCVASFGFPDAGNVSTIVSSIEFDKDYQFFAVAGVCKKIKIYEYGGTPAALTTSPKAASASSTACNTLYYPVVDMLCGSKISSISWNDHLKHLLASADYDGGLQIWDAYAGTRVREFHEHAKRVWSVDFNHVDPKMLASGSDDMKVRLCSTETESSVGILESRANVCCVQFSPTNRNLLAFGSADHSVVLYDLRSPRTPLYTCKNHKKAVAYVKFISGSNSDGEQHGVSNEFISASTDSSIRLWQYGAAQNFQQQHAPDSNNNSNPNKRLAQPLLTAEPRCVRTFRGHLNEKNFVGLDCDGGDYVASGSENNTLYVYNKHITRPILQYNFQQADENSSTMRNTHLASAGRAGDASDPFLSAVAWKRGSNVIVAANSLGIVQVLDMVG